MEKERYVSYSANRGSTSLLPEKVNLSSIGGKSWERLTYDIFATGY